MTIESVIFAHMRLAPVQINTWGHSVTSGIPTIDYYFSSELYEIPEAQNNYSEKLIKMKSLCTCYPTINIDIEPNDREELKIPDGKFILSCMQMRHKFKPEFLLFSAGFDAHIDDPLAQLRLRSEDFYKITKRTLELSKSFCSGNVVSILEGGYDLKALQNSTRRHVDALIEFN